MSTKKQNALQEKAVGGTKRKKRYLFGNLFRSSKKEMPLCTPLWTKTF
jgi:hypothetical protein